MKVSRPLKWRGLQARMTISYVLVTVISVFLLEILIFIALASVVSSAYTNALFPQVVGQVARQYALAAALQANGAALNPRSTFLPGQADSLLPFPDESHVLLPRGDTGTIPYTSARLPDSRPVMFGLLIEASSTVLTSSYPERYPNQAPVARLVPAHLKEISATLTNGTDAGGIETTPAGSACWVVVPVWGRDRNPIGAVFLQKPVVGPDGQLASNPPEIGKAALWGVIGGLVLLLILAPVGGIFGFMTTRRLVRRIRGLATATTAIAAGHHEQRVTVARRDEIGQLETRFNAMAEQLAESMKMRQDLAGENARLAERARIARELHDAISQHLFSLRMVVGGLERALPVESPLAPQIAALQEMAATMIREMRALLLELRPAQLEHLDLAEALEDLATAYRTRLGIAVTTYMSAAALPAPVEQVLLRIAQEALSNAARHAEATTIALELANQDNNILLTICDNGRGFDASTNKQGHGLGLHSMHERAQELGGTVVIESTPEQGTRIQVLLPHQPPEGAAAKGGH
jgi:NarL family two-component system sensor histidine kinase LiaS